MNTKFKHYGLEILKIILMLAIPAGIIYLAYSLIVWIHGSFGNFVFFIWNLLKLLVLFLISLAAAALFFIGGLHLFCRHRPVRVFISYQHEDESMAKAIAGALRDLDLKIEILLMQTSARDLTEHDLDAQKPVLHDTIIKKVKEGMKRSNALIAIPSAVEQSFAEAEVLAAYYLDKPMMFIVDQADRRLPNTALLGYPVFRYEDLEKHRFVPIRTFLDYLFFHRKDVGLSIARSIHWSAKGWLVLIIAFFLLGEAQETFPWWLGPDSALWATGWIYRILFGGAVIVTITGLSVEFWRKFKVRKIVRQQTITGGFTYKSLSRALSDIKEDKNILACLAQESLSTRHE